jgi:hypothetical protein
MNVLIEKYKGHLIYIHTATCIYTCAAIGELDSFYKMCRAIDALTKLNLTLIYPQTLLFRQASETEVYNRNYEHCS